jgi:ABC-2 type transport system ATP-binding protein/ribosome-dependent ATPase
MTAIEAQRLTRRYGDLVVVDDLSFEVSEGEIVGLLGANGAGKTTTMRMLLGLLAPTSGWAQLGGRPAVDADRRMMGYVPQGLGLYGDLTVRENLAFAASAFRVEMPDLESAGMADLAGRKVREIPLGMRRRVAFMVARCHDPSILILDEPTSGVSPLGRARLWETIHEAAEAGTAVLVSTHHLEEANECDRVLVMASGREVVSGTVEDIIGTASVVRVGGELADDDFESIRAAGGTVLVDRSGWRVVGLDIGSVRSLVGTDAEVTEIPASFEETFVSLST